jgi:hypothetical protein
MAAGETEVITTTLNDILNDAGYPFDNIYPAVPLISYLLLRDNKQGTMLGVNNRVRTYSDGNEIEIMVEYVLDNTVQMYTGINPITFAELDIVTDLKYEQRQGAKTLLMDKKKIEDCDGKSAKITNLVTAHLRGVNKGIANALNTQFLALVPGALDFNSIPHLVQYDPTLASVVGGLDQSNALYAWWRNKTTASAATTWALLMGEIDHLHNTVKYNMASDGPDLYLTNQTIYEMLIAYSRSKGTHTFMDNQVSNLFGMGDRGMVINGANLVWDTGVLEPAGEAAHSALYMLNTDYLQFNVNSKRQFKVEGPEDLIITKGQDAVAWVVLFRGQLTTSNRAKQGVLYSIDNGLTS